MAEKPIPAPLPSDLPENWTPGQIISPDGTSAGLSEQHGYNYLMRMVNRAQRGVNTLNEAMGQVGGKRTCRFTVGTSAAGWTEADCDYLCDGTDDQVEINQAISALGSTGGEIVLLSGTYHLSEDISMENLSGNISLRGNQGSTVLSGSNLQIAALTGSENAFTCYLSGIVLNDCNIVCNDANLTVQFCEFTESGVSIIGGYNPNSNKSFYCLDSRFYPPADRPAIVGMAQGKDLIVISGNTFRAVSGNGRVVELAGSGGGVESAVIFSENSVFCEETRTVYFYLPIACSRNNLVNCSLQAGGGGTISGNRISGGDITIESTYLEGTVLSERNMSTVSSNTIRNGRIKASGPVEIMANAIMAASNDGEYAPISIQKGASNSIQNATPVVIGNFVFGGRYGICLEPLPANDLNRVASHVLVSSNRIFGSTTPVKLNDGWKYCMVTDNMFDTGSIVDSGTGNIVRFNSDDPGGGSGGTESDLHGVPIGGKTGQILAKNSDDNYDMSWKDPTTGGSTAGVASFNGRSGEVTPGNDDYTAEMVGAVAAAAVKNIQTVTQAEYDALTAKNASTLYLIKE